MVFSVFHDIEHFCPFSVSATKSPMSTSSPGGIILHGRERVSNLHIHSHVSFLKSSERKCPSLGTRIRAGEGQEIVWDPEGLFEGSQKQSSFFKESKAVETSSIQELDSDFLSKHPIRSFKGNLSDVKKFKRVLAEKYMPVNMDLPNIRILHLDPPILLVDGVFTKDECLAIIETLKNTGKMAQSTVGAGNLYSTAVKGSHRRTSSSVLINQELQDAFPKVKEFAASIQAKSFEIIQGDKLGVWGQPGKQPLFEQYCFEALQAAEYQQGQHFLEHEDAFPLNIADENKFQRHATVLLYLNDVDSGGETKFNHLGISVKPKAGSVLLFFPAFSDGTPDRRTLHTATDANDVKWVTQQWIARGFNTTMKSHKEIQQGEKMGKALKSRKDRKSKTGFSKGFSS